jgi:S1-C subfamily serine protease
LNKKPAAASFFVLNQWLIRLVLSCAFSANYASIMLLFVTPTYAEAVPGGNIANSVIRAVDIAKPAVVRIITTLGGRLTVLLPNNKTAIFPLSGGTYQIQASASGAFISTHGDILTADHVIQPPHDATLNQFVEQEAA